MSYQEFILKVQENVQKMMGEKYEVRLEDVVMQNQENADALSIVPNGQGVKISPIFYLEDYYNSQEEMQNPDLCSQAIVEKYLSLEQTAQSMKDTVVQEVWDWQKIKMKVYPILISQSMNQGLLGKLVWRPMLDLAICYVIRIKLDQTGSSMIKVTDFFLKEWGITEEELHIQAMQNLKEDGYSLVSLEQMCEKLMHGTEVNAVDQMNETDAFIMTNEQQCYGAAGLLDQEFMKRITNKTSCYIIPSSVHELLLLPLDMAQSSDELNQVVSVVNDTEVQLSDRLSDHVYYYDADKEEIRVA